ncbi:uncharacterized protein LOC127869234 isoform X2 [Dreissena polymorpha]|uniref:uncharacterized protein LOC127869234 isoform X2 n=1 Tax=Dreissena polymorpha TaxID=45954 RepID=UPI002265603F|nr:uncharacterized protein LOC127869234 isoform X2 [Dreissena polymorpha]
MQIENGYMILFTMAEGGYWHEETDHERARRPRGLYTHLLEVPWQRESIETSTVMNSLGYGSHIRKARREVYDSIGSAHVFTTGSKAEGLTNYLESDMDIMTVLQDVMCLENDVSYDILPRKITVFTLNTGECYHGHCRLALERLGANIHTSVRNALCADEDGRALLCSDLYVNAYDELHVGVDPRNVRHERAGPSTPRSLIGAFNIDIVHSLYCYCPSILRKWAERRRHWPPPDVVHKIVSMGAFVTPVGFKGSEYKHVEWRICFNTGENYLVNCLNNTQVYIYVLLKMVIKEVLKPLKKELSSYTVKNIVLWIAENIPQELFNERTLLHWLREGLVELRSAILTENLSYYMITERNLMAACGLDETQKRTWIQMITDMIDEGPKVLRRIPKIRRAIISHPEPLMWYGKRRMEIELLVLKQLIKMIQHRAYNDVESDTMIQAINRRIHEILRSLKGCVGKEVWLIIRLIYLNI